MFLPENQHRLNAKERYREVAMRAELREAWRRVTGRGRRLLKYGEVAAALQIRQQIRLGVQIVALDDIVGSVGRHTEFTAEFHPRFAVEEQRWANVDVQMHGLAGLPPVELYRIGAAYFVLDGNHRISVARANGCIDMEAYVTDCLTPTKLTVSDFLSGAWRAKALATKFANRTGLNRSRPDHGIAFSHEEHEETLLNHIAVHRYFYGRRLAQTVSDAQLSWEEAAANWYDSVYSPVVEAIRSTRAFLRFSHLTDTELYVGVTHRREMVAAQYGLAPLGPEAAVAVYVAAHAPSPFGLLRQWMRAAVRWGTGKPSLPPGMSAKEFDSYRTRRQAGEMTIAEARNHGRLALFDQGHSGSYVAQAS